jgi:predicted PurR-regulated permease PerM
MSESVGIDPNRIGAKALTFALVAAVVVLLLPYVTGLLGAAVLYVVARPLLTHLERRRARRAAAVATVFALFAILVIPGIWIFTEAVGQIPDAIRSFETSPEVKRVMALRVGSIEVGPQLERAAAEVFRWGSRQTIGALGGLLAATINLVIALFGTYYLLMSGGQLWDRVRPMLPFCPTTSELLRLRFYKVTEAMMLGVVVAAITQGTLVGAAFAILELPHALFWGAVTACASILPMFGSALVWLPATAFLLLQQRFGQAIALAAFGVVIVSNIDNVLRLIVYRRVSQIHPMVTLVGAFAGVNAFGLVGLVLGPLVLSYAVELARIHSAGHVQLVSPDDPGQGFPVVTPSISPTPAIARSA